jgi:hypothetical protein
MHNTFLNDFGISYIIQPRAHQKRQRRGDDINTQNDITVLNASTVLFKKTQLKKKDATD